MRRALFTALMLTTALPLHVGAAEPTTRAGKALREALAGDVRTDAERARDANRKPVATLEFFGLEPDMRVLELMPGGGWYTKLLAPVLRDEGELYVALGGLDAIRALRKRRGFDHIHILDMDVPYRNVGRQVDITRTLNFAVRDVDLVLTFRNLHNLTEHGRRMVNQASFEALAPGGLYGVIDHTRRHMQPDGPENWRRLDPVRMIREIESVGFEFVEYADLHYRPDDELRYEVGRRSVTGNSDRFTFLFRKPY